METRKRLGPSEPGTGVARDSEARDPMGGGNPRLGGGARRRDATRRRDGGTCGTECGTRVCTSPLHHLTDIRCQPTDVSLNVSLNSQRFNTYGALRQQCIHRKAKTRCLSASRGVCIQYCQHLSHRLVGQTATISIRSKHLCTDSFTQPEGLACHADLYIHILSPKFVFHYWLSQSRLTTTPSTPTSAARSCSISCLTRWSCSCESSRLFDLCPCHGLYRIGRLAA